MTAMVDDRTMTNVQELEARIALLTALLTTTVDEKAAMGIDERLAELKALLARLTAGGPAPDG